MKFSAKAALVLTVLGALSVTGCSASAPRTADGNVVTSKTATEVRNSFTSAVQDTINTAGGSWTYRDKSAFKPDQASDFLAVGCGQAEKTWLFNINLMGPAVPDPVQAIKKVSDHWKANGVEVGAVGGWDATPAAGVDAQKEISGITKDGVKLTYHAGTAASSLAGTSVCSTDSSMAAAVSPN
ncbi:MAG: hypothetical protein HIU81_02085 [Acidobacteria bacterium]|nr:hypothetical protein [Acidobacteriota bacterium]